MDDPRRNDPSAHPKFYHLERPTGVPTHNSPMRHAYVVVGTDTMFLCHQIMGFMEGHNYELVLEVELPDKIRQELVAERERDGVTHFLANQGDDVYTLPDVKTGRVASFTADIWNFFPRPSQWGDHWPWTTPPRFADVHVRIRRIIHYRHLDFNETGRRSESYLMFGKAGEAHLYHSVVDQPDYDHVATLAQIPEWIQAEQLEAGVIVSMPDLPWHRHSGRCKNPLPPGTHRVLYFGIEQYRDPHGQDTMMRIPVPAYSVDVAHTWWFSTRVVNFFPENPCPDLEDIPELK